MNSTLFSGSRNTTSMIVLIAIIVLPGVILMWDVNTWSVNFVRTVIGEENVTLRNIESPPSTHRSAPVWLARQEVLLGNSRKAKIIARPLAEEGNRYALSIIGDVLFIEGDITGAVESWQNAGAYDVLNRVAIETEKEGKYEEALLLGRAVWNLNPELGTITLATIMRNNGDLDEARNLLYQSIFQYSDSTQKQKWILLLCDILREQESWDDVVDLYSQLLADHPKNTLAHIGLGWAYYERGDGIEKALAEFQEVMDITPDLGVSYLAMGQVLAREGDYLEADKWFELAVEKAPENRWWALARANNLRNAEKYTRSVILYADIIEHYPDWSWAAYEIAWAYRLDNKKDEAVQAISRALMLLDEDEILFYLRAGKIYEWVELPDQALEMYYTVLSISPKNQFALEAIDRLSEDEQQQ